MPSELFEELRTAEPDALRLEQIQRSLSRSLKPIAPLPSDRVLVALWMSAFILIVSLATMTIGFPGVHALGIIQRAIYYGVLLVSALLLAIAATEQMIPGARRRVPVTIAVLFPLIAMMVVVPALFPVFEMQRFFEQGTSCLRIGLLCAISSSALTAIVIRRGFVTDWLSAAAIGGALSGLVGVSVLALHCPIQSAPHIMAWHVGVLVAAIAGGAFVGRVLSRSR